MIRLNERASVGAGFINLSNNAGSEDLQAMANYFDNIAVFAKQAIQIWFVSSDENLNQQIQVLNNTGTIAPQSVVEFGDNDVFYLSVSGVRSLRREILQMPRLLAISATLLTRLLSSLSEAMKTTEQKRRESLTRAQEGIFLQSEARDICLQLFPVKQSVGMVYIRAGLCDRRLGV